ncbi:hypothetical protein [Aneurinibacillus tyrosinisolvens]|uniref:hypothetical protein n=1 Tax=Aneurinibacillus tyrosinisolvens TaxID=1443435 RepID=UPI00063F98E4|nr:hypothetical protein [Aneurinibacillus tyrosinisolvens]
MLVTMNGTQTSETIDIHFDSPQTVGAVLEIILAIHPRFLGELPLQRDRSSMESALSIYTADNILLTLTDTVTNDAALEICFHGMM